MLEIERRLEDARKWCEAHPSDVLSIYAVVDPTRQENRNRAWLTRIRNALQELPETVDQKPSKHRGSLREQVLEVLEKEPANARTLVVFAGLDERGDLELHRLDLNIELPVADFAHGRALARYGKPYVTPLYFAVDEYQRTGIVVVKPSGQWRVIECFVGEVREDETVFASVDANDWAQLEEATRRIAAAYSSRALKPGGRFDKLSPQERAEARLDTWTHRFMSALGRLVEQAGDRWGIDRWVLVGERWRVSMFEACLRPRIRRKVQGHLTLDGADEAPAAQIWREASALLEKLEREGELELLRRIREQPGVWGVDEVLDAVQMGSIKTWVIPWSMDFEIWRCEDSGYVAANQETARAFCAEPQKAWLSDWLVDIANANGVELEFVRGAAETRLIEEMGGMAGLRRW